MSLPQSPPQDYETPVLRQGQGERHTYQTLEMSQGPGKDKAENHTCQILEQSLARDGVKKDFPSERKDDHVYQALMQQDRETKLYANQFELQGNDSGLYTSVATTSSGSSGRVHSASMSMHNGTGKRVPPQDCRYVTKEGSSCVQDDNHKRAKLFSIALICCGLLAFMLVMGVAIAALVLALNASNASCDCPEIEPNLLFQMNQFAEEIDANRERIERNEQNLYAQELYFRESIMQLNYSLTQNIDTLEEEVGLIDTRLGDAILKKLGDCTTSIESSCQTSIGSCTTRTVNYQRTDEIVLNFFCSSSASGLQSAVATLRDNLISCTCRVIDFDFVGEETCDLSVTRCM